MTSNIRERYRYNGRTDLHILTSATEKSEIYRDEVVNPHSRFSIGNNFILIDDNARPHHASLATNYLESEGPVNEMTRPAYFPISIQ